MSICSFRESCDLSEAILLFELIIRILIINILNFRYLVHLLYLHLALNLLVLNYVYATKFLKAQCRVICVRTPGEILLLKAGYCGRVTAAESEFLDSKA